MKTLRRDVKISFPDLSEDDLDQLLPAKAEVQLLKLKNKATAYTSGSADPLFFDPEGRGDLLVPTVYALWRCPHMLDQLHTYSEVSPKVGALPRRCACPSPAFLHLCSRVACAHACTVLRSMCLSRCDTVQVCTSACDPGIHHDRSGVV